MSTITLTKNEEGKLAGFTPRDERAFRKFMRKLEGLSVGDFLTLEFWFPRDSVLHRKHFKMLATITDQQERFDDLHEVRMWLQVGAGHCIFVPGVGGELVAIPRSINFRTIDDAEFYEHHMAVKAFLRSDHAMGYLWPHLSPGDRVVMVETILEPFERGR